MTSNRFSVRTVGLQIYLVLALTACAHAGPTKLVPIPAEMTEAVPEPQLEGSTNASLVDWIERLRAALREANRRLGAIGGIRP